MWTAYVILFLAGSGLALFLTPLVRRLAVRAGFLDRPDLVRKTHASPVPYGGGIAIVLAAMLPMAAAALTACWCREHGRPSWLTPGVYDAFYVHLGGIMKRLPEFATVLAGGVAIFVLGLVDDRKRLGPFVKLAVQLAVAVAVVLSGVRVTLFMGSEIAGGVVTVLWIVGITNAFNFLDNMDGLSAGVALIIGATFFAVALVSGQLFIAAALAPFVGALAGFLPFNLAPARIFMGDAGSLFIGYYLSVLSVLFTYYQYSLGPTAAFRPFILPLILFAVPLYDFVSVTIIRLGEGRSPFSGDRRHLSHRLVDLGLSSRLAVGAIHLLTFGIALAAVFLYLVQTPFGEAAALIQAVALLALVVVIERAIRT